MIKTASGLQFEDLVEGHGQSPIAGETCIIDYICWVWSDGHPGAKYGSSHDTGGPIGFVLGDHRVSPGWEEGVATMRPGGKRRLLVPDAVAYIPPGPSPTSTTPIFLVEIVLLRVCDPVADASRAAFAPLPPELAAFLVELCLKSRECFPQGGFTPSVVVGAAVPRPDSATSAPRERVAAFLCCCVLGNTECSVPWAADPLVERLFDVIERSMNGAAVHIEVAEVKGWFTSMELWITTAERPILIVLDWDVG